MNKTILYMLLVATLIACQFSGDEKTSNLQRVAMVSVSEKGYVMSTAAKVMSWKPGATYVVSSDKIKADDIKPAIESAIKEVLNNKGYDFSAYASNPQLVVSYLAALEEDVGDDEIVRQFGVMPGFSLPNPDAKKYEKGTIVIDITDVALGKSVWRGAVQGFAAFDRSRQERKERVMAVIGDLMAQIPSPR